MAFNHVIANFFEKSVFALLAVSTTKNMYKFNRRNTPIREETEIFVVLCKWKNVVLINVKAVYEFLNGKNSTLYSVLHYLVLHFFTVVTCTDTYKV